MYGMGVEMRGTLKASADRWRAHCDITYIQNVSRVRIARHKARLLLIL